MDLQVLRELAEDVAKLQSITFGKTWQFREAPIGWKRGNITPIFLKGKPGELQIGQAHLVAQGM